MPHSEPKTSLDVADTRVAVLLAPGFEEIEAVAVVDVLRRAGVNVTVAGTHGAAPVEGAHGLTVIAEASVDSLEPGELDMIVLPGGMPGAANLACDARVLALVRDVYGAGRAVAAICAAPIVLHAAGLLHGKRVTAYPSFEPKLVGAVYTGARVEQDGMIITSRGPGTALEFALRLVAVLGLPDAADQLRTVMQVHEL